MTFGDFKKPGISNAKALDDLVKAAVTLQKNLDAEFRSDSALRSMLLRAMETQAFCKYLTIDVSKDSHDLLAQLHGQFLNTKS